MRDMTETYVTQEEFRRLETRVAAVEQDVDGEKLVSRYILSQSRQNGDDLAALKTRVDRIEEKVDGLDHRMERLEGGLSALRRELPGIVADAMRDVLRDTSKR
jgi:tetrahydromethanopterin S-methyltransferase subunit G